MGKACKGIISNGADGTIIDVECHVTNNLPTIVITGYAGRTVHEAKDRLRGAFASQKLELPRRRITINLAPADLPKAESSLDLAMATAIIACAHDAITISSDFAAVGELGLDGITRPVRGIIGKLLAGRRLGLCSFFVPEANMEQASLVPGINLLPVTCLAQLQDHLLGLQPITPIATGNGRAALSATSAPDTNELITNHSLDDIIGQFAAKRALVIAAAGGHNLLLQGPPGTGKSMLAGVLPGLLPAMDHEEMLEVTQLQSLSGQQYEKLIKSRPLRTPHHGASHTAMVGGGSQLRPGEISLSHRGVLYLDEFPEFNRQTLEALRQPLEDGHITVSRSKDSVRYPADFLLVATANPCPCGYNGYSLDRCECSAALLHRYRARLSGPILDRIDLCCDVHEVDHKKLLTQPDAGLQQTALAQVAQARAIQAKRNGGVTHLNSRLSNRELRLHARLSRPCTAIMQNAAHSFQLSARGYMRTLKVARTIADIDESTAITPAHLTEALGYRRRTQTG